MSTRNFANTLMMMKKENEITKKKGKYLTNPSFGAVVFYFLKSFIEGFCEKLGKLLDVLPPANVLGLSLDWLLLIPKKATNGSSTSVLKS